VAFAWIDSYCVFSLFYISSNLLVSWIACATLFIPPVEIHDLLIPLERHNAFYNFFLKESYWESNHGLSVRNIFHFLPCVHAFYIYPSTHFPLARSFSATTFTFSVLDSIRSHDLPIPHLFLFCSLVSLLAL